MGAYPKGAHRGLQLVGAPAAHTLKGEARGQIINACRILSQLQKAAPISTKLEVGRVKYVCRCGSV